MEQATRNELRKLSQVVNRKRMKGDAVINQYPFDSHVPLRRVVLRGVYRQPKRIATAPLTGEVLMRELNPPLLSDEERGQGDSVNARLHRILYPQRPRGG